jgi:hypothetical protein
MLLIAGFLRHFQLREIGAPDMNAQAVGGFSPLNELFA